LATLRDQVLARRNSYLERIAVFDDLWIKSEVADTRVAGVRHFLEGGDDIPPECEAKGIKPERRRITGIPQLERDAAFKRLEEPKGNQVSDQADWDNFIQAGGGEFNLYRITALLMRATEYWERDVKLDVDAVLHLRVKEFPPLTDTANSVPKAWMLLDLCGTHLGRLKRAYQPLLDSSAGVKRQDHDLSNELAKSVESWLGSQFGVFATKGQTPPTAEALPERVFQDGCPCNVRKPPPAPPPGASQPPPPPPPPALDQAIIESADAVLAAYGLDSPHTIIDEFKSIKAEDVLIAHLLLWLKERWDEVGRDRKYDSASSPWQIRHPAERRSEYSDPDNAPYPNFFASGRWLEAREQFDRLRDVGKHFQALSTKSVRQVCVELVKATWPEDDKCPYDDEEGLRDNADIDRDEFVAAADRTLNADDCDDCPFRLAALLSQPEAYKRVLDQLSTLAETGTGANRLARPTYDPLSAFYWRVTVLHSTIGHILTMKDTADFHTTEHIRFLGLFRPGSAYRQARPRNSEYQAWISTFIPEWLTDFMKAALLRFKYWLEDPPLNRQNDEEMVYWSENHQMLFASSEYITGSWWHDEVFAYTGKGNFWHHNRALPRIRAWLDHRIQFGFSEVDSGTYYNQHLPGIFNLVDFADNDEIQKKAMIVLDLMVFDIVRRTCQGSFVAASGRAYWGSKRSGWSVSIVDFIELLTGAIGDHVGTSESSACSFATSRYRMDVPEALIAMGVDRGRPIADRSRTSISLDDGPRYGIEHDTAEGIVFWWGCGAYFTNKTMDTTQSWSYRWGLRSTDPFTLFNYIDAAIIRLVLAVVGFFTSITGLAVAVARQAILGNVLLLFSGLLSGIGPPGAGSGPAMVNSGGYAAGIMNLIMLGPHAVRRFIDIILSVLDLVIGTAAALLKEVGVLDENDDRVRVARPALEQEFRALAIEFNEGSVLGRQHVYTWRSADAMLSSLVEDTKGATSAQKEPCIASLGLNVSVFTGKRTRIDSEHNFGSDAAAATGAYFEGVAKYAYDPDTFVTQQLPWSEGEAMPEVGEALVPIVGNSMFGGQGPAYWFGSLSSPLAYQNENVAISMYQPREKQLDLGPDETHAHWPWDHFDEVVTQERNGGRWIFGRRDRRFPPRTPCEPRPELRPTDANPWFLLKRREESQVGSGYVALFSANGFSPSKVPGWAHRELVATGRDNIWITVVGDRLTYGSFDEFQKDVLAATLEVSVGNLTCAITMPLPGSADGEKGPKFAANWEAGGKVGGTEITTANWPKFEHRLSSLKAKKDPPQGQFDLVVDSIEVTSVADPQKQRVDWDEKAWRIVVNVQAWQEIKTADGKTKFERKADRLLIEYNLTRPESPVRTPSREGIEVYRNPDVTIADIAGAKRWMAAKAQKKKSSPIAKPFRDARKKIRLGRRHSWPS
jgi:hypothetical protein